jgi:class 3 adenylate cyclase
VRIGLHEAEATRKGHDFQDKGVHQAARIGALAEAGEILASRDVVGRQAGFVVSAPRTVILRGISHPVEVVGIDWR